MKNVLWWIAAVVVTGVVVLFVDGLDGSNAILDSITYGK